MTIISVITCCVSFKIIHAVKSCYIRDLYTKDGMVS